MSPGFQVGSVFAAYLYGDLATGPDNRPVWEIRERTSVGEGELYVFPAHRPLPKEGSEVCRITHGPTKTPAAYVFGP